MADQAKQDIQPSRMIIRHLSGSKTNQVEEFALAQLSELTIGRTATSLIKYDPDQDDLVSREHAKIEQDPDDATQFTVTDLNSRNGTFVNKQRIIGLARIKPGDIVQFGPGGPEFEFDLDPRPDSLMKATRMAEMPAARPTRATPAPDRPTAAPVAATAEPGTVGKATVERMVTEVKTESNRLMMVGGVGLLALVAVILLLVLPGRGDGDAGSTITPPPPVDDGLSASDIFAANMDATVLIEAAWKLQHTPTGRQVYHQYVDMTAANFAWYQGYDGTANGITPYDNLPAGQYAAYMMLDDGTLEPVLTVEDGSGLNAPVGGMHTGSGFVVTNDGFIMTNRHVAATWLTDYVFPSDAFPGIVYAQTGGEYMPVGVVTKENMTSWIPSRTRSMEFKMLGGLKTLEGNNLVLDVTFAKNERRTPANLAGISNAHDVAMIKVNMPRPLPKVELAEADSGIQPGDAVTVLGYPAIAPAVFTLRESGDYFNRFVDINNVPDPTVTAGSLGRIIRGTQAPAGRTKYEYWSSFGDAYQLTVNATGSGNSGGPVFDDQGRVTGIFFAGTWDPDATRITFAVPIRYGLELMGPQTVIE